MGIVNVTPDSFSDGGRYAGTQEAIAHGLELLEQGADILDIGGESTRPGAAEVTEQEELERVVRCGDIGGYEQGRCYSRSGKGRRAHY